MAVFDAKQLAFIEAVATGAKLYEAYIDVYGVEGMSTQTATNYGKKIATPEVRKAIKERKEELMREAAERDGIVDELEEAGDITRDRLIRECDYAIRHSKRCVFKKLNGVPIINRDAANVYLKAIEVAAKLTGAYEQEEKTDSTVVVKFDTELDELAK